MADYSKSVSSASTIITPFISLLSLEPACSACVSLSACKVSCVQMSRMREELQAPESTCLNFASLFLCLRAWWTSATTGPGCCMKPTCQTASSGHRLTSILPLCRLHKLSRVSLHSLQSCLILFHIHGPVVQPGERKESDRNQGCWHHLILWFPASPRDHPSTPLSVPTALYSLPFSVIGGSCVVNTTACAHISASRPEKENNGPV